MARVCLDLTANEMLDRFGGIGRYGYHLLRWLLELPDAERRGIELCVLEESASAVISPEAALARGVLSKPPIPMWQHRWQRRLLSSSFLARAGADIFHAVQPVAAPRSSRAKLLVTCHDLIPIVHPQPAGALKARWVAARETFKWRSRMHRADHIIAISEQTASDLSARLAVPRSKISVVYHGVDRELFDQHGGTGAVRQRFGLPERWFVSVGSDHYRKNHAPLFRAWCNASRDIPEGLVFVGKALYESTLQQIGDTVARLGLEDRFQWLNEVDDSDLPALYRGATAAVAPSLYEGFGMTLLEAMSCGTPVAAARNGVYEEVGADAALYFDGHSVEQIEACLRQLSTNAGVRERLRSSGLARVSEMTWRHTARKTLDVYQKLAAVE